MKKIMFNDQYGLTQAVLDGRKTMTRREESFLSKLTYTYGQQGMGTRIEVLPCGEVRHYRKDSDSFIVIGKSRFQVGEVVAVAQSYNDVYKELKRTHGSSSSITRDFFHKYIQGGRMPVSNKMFVRSEAMLHQIKITDIKVERIQDISDDDCLKEGINEDLKGVQYSFDSKIGYCGQFPFATARQAFAALIDKVSGKGTWEKNPFCFCYEFKLIK